MFSKNKRIVVGSRESPLAKEQVKIFLKAFRYKFGNSNLKHIDKKYFKTTGDKFLNKKISNLGNKALFTKEIDDAQLNNKIDIAVHSLKDLPTDLPKGLFLSGVLKREDPNDVVFSTKDLNLKESRKKLVVGTSSIRRKVQLQKLNSRIQVKDIRGNVGTRIKKVIEGNYDCIILAAAGLKRLNITNNYKKIDIRNIVPSAGQGVIALVTRKNKMIEGLIKELNHSRTFIESDCERLFLKSLDGSCKTPIGAIAKFVKKEKKDYLFFRYMASSLDGKRIIKGSTFFKLSRYKKMSLDLGKKIKRLI